MLFVEPAQPRTTPLGWTEPSVHWFTESTRPEAAASRAVVNGWYEGFPDPDGRFASRLISENDVDHHQALDELHVHHLLRRRYDDVRYEEHGAGPDFRVYREGQCVAGLEVLSLFQRQDWSEEEWRNGRLVDDLNRRVPPTDGYFVHLEIETWEMDPSFRRFAEFVARELAKLPPHHERLALEHRTGASPLTVTYDHAGVRIRVTFLPMQPDAPSKSNPDARIVGIGPMIGRLANTGKRLRDRVAAKAGGRYDIADAPFIVIVGVHDTVFTDDDAVEALHGGESVNVQTGELRRRNDGLFGVDADRGSGRHRRLSGVVVVNDLHVWEPGMANLVMYENPYAARPLGEEGLLPTLRRFPPT